MNVTLGLSFVASHRKEWPMTFIAVRCHPEICYHLSSTLKFEMHSITHGGASYGERRL